MDDKFEARVILNNLKKRFTIKFQIKLTVVK